MYLGKISDTEAMKWIENLEDRFMIKRVGLVQR